MWHFDLRPNLHCLHLHLKHASNNAKNRNETNSDVTGVSFLFSQITERISRVRIFILTDFGLRMILQKVFYQTE